MDIIVNILVIDDSTFICSMVSNIFPEDQFEVVAAHSGNQALDWLDEHTPDIILLDLVLPDMDGYEVCGRLKSQEKLADIPIIFLTSNNDEKSILKSFAAGAVDYIAKPFSMDVLKARVSCHLKNKMITNELRQAYDKLEMAMEKISLQSMQDPLTHLYNRRYFLDKMEDWKKGGKKALYFILLDLDNFKFYNDTYGHCTGDYVLYTVADLLVQCAGDGAIAGRWGGDEFLVVLTDSTAPKAKAVAKKIITGISSYEFHYDSNFFQCSVTAGISRFHPEYNIEKNITLADQALYEGKKNGKNTFVFKSS